MKCTVCENKCSPATSHFVWRSLQSTANPPIQFAKMPLCGKCTKKVEHEIMKSKIRIAAKVDGFIFSMKPPKRIISEDGMEVRFEVFSLS